MTDDTPAPKPDGGPAFPNPAVGFGGMTLRDWFAGQALCGAASGDTPKALAEWAYKLADAMIAHRNATREG